MLVCHVTVALMLLTDSVPVLDSALFTKLIGVADTSSSSLHMHVAVMSCPGALV